jgi:hypothetical protein
LNLDLKKKYNRPKGIKILWFPGRRKKASERLASQFNKSMKKKEAP